MMPDNINPEKDQISRLPATLRLSAHERYELGRTFWDTTPHAVLAEWKPALSVGLAGSGRRRRWGRAAGQEQGQQEVKGGTQSRRLHTGAIVGNDGRVGSVR